MESLTPEQLFFRYAWPCSEKRLGERKITDRQYQALKEYRDNPHLCPPRNLLETCFPQIFDALRILGNETSRSTWDSPNVAEYWRMYHEGPSPVRVYKVEEIRGNGTVIAARRGTPLQLLSNPYSLYLRNGSQVYVHVDCAIELYREQ